MAHHQVGTNRLHVGWLVPLLAIVLVGGGTAVGKLSAPGGTPAAGTSSTCAEVLTVVAASSFVPVLSTVAPAVSEGPNCARLDVVPADGRAAAAEMAARGADVWIPDDAAWAGTQGMAQLAPAPTAGAGTVLATSPFYLVTDAGTAERVTGVGGGWRGLDRLLAGPAEAPPPRLVVRDPAGSGDGMLGVGAIGEAVWITDGMDASALALARAMPAARTVPGAEPALPRTPGEVGAVPEYALLPVLRSNGVAPGTTALAPTDHTAVLRFSWLPTAAAAADPATAAQLARLLDALTGDAAAPGLAAAGLRRPDAAGPPGEPVPGLPAVTAPPYEVLKPHHVDHVFAIWYPADRRADVLVAVDVSGSMNARAPGSPRRLIELVKDGFTDLGRLLPDDAELGLWEFGVRLDPPRDYQVLLPSAELTTEHRRQVDRAIDRLSARSPGTGLHDTVLAAYTVARDRYRAGVPNHVVVFTDGHNEADPGSLTLTQLSTQLAQARDPARPVKLTVVAFGGKSDPERLEKALEPVAGFVSQPTTAEAVSAVFLHVAAGGVHD
jgi:von Willebrand factor type A domain/Bacterial extracellular solute-binding protein